MRKFFLGLAALGALAGCTNTNEAQTIASLEIGLTSAEGLATAYVKLPRCPVQEPVCSDQSVVQKIRDADNGAYTEIKKAEALIAQGQPADMTAASTALQTLLDAVHTPAVQAALTKGSK